MRVGAVCIQDQVVWDLANPDASAERFAHAMVADLKLDKRLAPEICWQLHEQMGRVRRSHRRITGVLWHSEGAEWH